MAPAAADLYPRGDSTPEGVPTERSDARDRELRGRPRWLGVVETVSLAAFALCWGAVWLRVLAATPGPRLLWLLPAALLVGFAAADFVSGCVHWLADRFFDPSTPLLGPMLIEPFREHHRDPRGITRHGLPELLGNNALATLPLAAGLLIAEEPDAGVARQALHAGVAALALALLATNVFHCWAHTPSPPPLVAWLQARRVLLSPQSHDRHHRGAHDRSYCVTSGWLNPLLDRSDFFGRLEGLLASAGIGRERAPRSRLEAPLEPSLERSFKLSLKPSFKPRGRRAGGR